MNERVNPKACLFFCFDGIENSEYDKNKKAIILPVSLHSLCNSDLSRRNLLHLEKWSKRSLRRSGGESWTVSLGDTGERSALSELCSCRREREAEHILDHVSLLPSFLSFFLFFPSSLSFLLFHFFSSGREEERKTRNEEKRPKRTPTFSFLSKLLSVTPRAPFSSPFASAFSRPEEEEARFLIQGTGGIQ